MFSHYCIYQKLNSEQKCSTVHNLPPILHPFLYALSSYYRLNYLPRQSPPLASAMWPALANRILANMSQAESWKGITHWNLFPCTSSITSSAWPGYPVEGVGHRVAPEASSLDQQTSWPDGWTKINESNHRQVAQLTHCISNSSLLLYALYVLLCSKS